MMMIVISRFTVVFTFTSNDTSDENCFLLTDEVTF